MWIQDSGHECVNNNPKNFMYIKKSITFKMGAYVYIFFFSFNVKLFTLKVVFFA